MGETNKETGSGFDEIFSFFFLESIDLNLLLAMNNSKWFYIIIFRKFSHNSSHFYSENKRHDRLLPPSWKIARTKSASSSPGRRCTSFTGGTLTGPERGGERHLTMATITTDSANPGPQTTSSVRWASDNHRGQHEKLDTSLESALVLCVVCCLADLCLKLGRVLSFNSTDQGIYQSKTEILN